jgi:hypothetical protein
LRWSLSNAGSRVADNPPSRAPPLPRYLEQAAQQRQTIVLCNDKRPIAEIRLLVPPGATPRPLGLGKGKGHILDSFYEPLPDNLLDAFEGKNL